MKKILALLTLLCSFAALGQPERSLFDIEHELKRIILFDFSATEAIERRAAIEPLIIGTRYRTQFLFELSNCGIESNTLNTDWIRQATKLIKKAQEIGSKELEMYARFCRAHTNSMQEDSAPALTDANIIADWAENNLPTYKHLAYANRVRLLAFKKSTLYSASDSYRDYIIGLSFAEGDDQLAETKIAIADLLILLNDFEQTKPLFDEIEQHLQFSNNFRTKSEYLITRTVYHRHKKEYAEALATAEQAIEIAQQGQLDYHAGIGYIYQILIHGELGNVAQALKNIDEIPKGNKYLTGSRRKLYLDLAFAKIYSVQQLPNKAIVHAEDAYTALKQIPESHYHITATLQFAELLAQTKQWQRSATVFQEYIDLSTNHMEQVQSQYNDVTNIRFQFEQQRHQKQQASLQHQLQQQQIRGLEASQKWQILAIGTFLTLFLMMAASALHYRRRNKHSLESVSVDQLTQLANRNEIIHLASQALVKAQKSKQPISIALLDIESFRSVNDNFGVEIGDQILAEFAEILARRVGSKGMLGRYGGDEFMVVLPSVIAHEAETICAELLAIIQQTTFRQAELEIQLSVSFGISSSNAEAVSVSTLLTRAEDGLATAKQQGGSKVVSNAIG
ncbi:GGDEF domain-containing protein [Neiella marina]|uniref:diguanylate cyclase n=1 Tax=Neiella holothuriorum TaxID=2870530 RepID=A0ABS7EFH6_9GAMM|nr:GGDEF domain-containing protein [Neiella holothuriorum]MBW8190964.1 GGDEF domain-containing protein [Neiella holothuriorum]